MENVSDALKVLIMIKIEKYAYIAQVTKIIMSLATHVNAHLIDRLNRIINA